MKKTTANVLLPSRLKDSLSRNKKYHNCHKGERCFVLATGPSINDQDLAPLKSELCIAVGSFYLHKDVRIIDPLYHVESPNHEPFSFKDIELYLTNYTNYYSPKTKYFFGHTHYKCSFYNYIQQLYKSSQLDINYLNYAGSAQISEQNYTCSNQWDITRNLFWCRTVVYSAIQLAAYMGCKEIYLLGCDHDYLKRYFEDGFENHHFYSDSKGPEAVKEILDSFTLERWFEEYYFRWQQYRLMNAQLESMGCKIFNATKGGMLDVFPRVHLEDIV
jgi:hypothetical protein